MAKVRQPRFTRSEPGIHAGALEELRREAAACRGCGLWRTATQTVFGSGPATARLMLVGEQPGDQEDLAGEPFVGAAGRVLREALDAAGLDPAEIYLTNAVKHFKWTPRGKRRIHERPNHPSSILRAPDWESRTLAMRQFIDDLKLVAGALNARRR